MAVSRVLSPTVSCAVDGLTATLASVAGALTTTMPCPLADPTVAVTVVADDDPYGATAPAAGQYAALSVH